MAAKLGYRRGPMEKVVRLVSALEGIAGDPYLNERLALKGGTALNLFVGRPARLSIDADLDYVGKIDREAMKKERPRVIARLTEVGKGLDYRVKIVREPYALSEMQFRYQSSTGADELLKLEVNFVGRVPILGRVEPIRCVLPIPGERMPVMCLPLDEIAGLKLGTLCVRGAARDLFDVASFGGLQLNRAVVRKVALFRGFLESTDLSLFDVESMNTITERDLQNEVTDLLVKGSAIARDELLISARQWTNDLLPLKGKEPSFAEDLRRGQFWPEKLFEGISTSAQLSKHPGMLLRLDHARTQEA